jgi:hypothetical protein
MGAQRLSEGFPLITSKDLRILVLQRFPLSYCDIGKVAQKAVRPYLIQHSSFHISFWLWLLQIASFRIAIINYCSYKSMIDVKTC